MQLKQGFSQVASGLWFWETWGALRGGRPQEAPLAARPLPPPPTQAGTEAPGCTAVFLACLLFKATWECLVIYWLFSKFENSYLNVFDD